jgi:UDP-glucose 4-epimerase
MLTHTHLAKAPSRVVLLGAGGFLSPHLQRLCQEHGVNHEAVGRQRADLTSESSRAVLEGMWGERDTVVMLASVPPDQGKGYGTLMQNLRMAENVCATLAKNPCAHFIYLSSDAVYDAREVPLDEDSSREPVSTYALMHTAREMMFAEVLGLQKIPYAILRPSAIFGQGDTHNAYGPNRFLRSAREDGTITLFGEGEELRNHIFVADVIEIIRRVIWQCSEGTLNVTLNPAISFRELADHVVRVCATPVELKFFPRQLPVVHRPHRSTQLAEAFPDFIPTSTTSGLQKTWQRLAA